MDKPIRKLCIPYSRVHNRVYVLRWNEQEALLTPLNAKIKYERARRSS